MPEISGISVAMAFLAGLVSFLSPCVLPLVPGYVSYVAGQSVDRLMEEGMSRARLATVGLSGCFVVGFSTVFIAMGASASALGQLLLSYRYEANYVAGAIVILFGLFLMGLLRIGWLQRQVRFGDAVKGGRPVGAYVLGTAFAFGWTPCIGPILGGILALGAATAGVAEGTALLAIYSAGLAVPFLLVSAFTPTFMDRLKVVRRLGRPLQILAGAVLVAMGVAIVTNSLSPFAFWILETFPGLQAVLL